MINIYLKALIIGTLSVFSVSASAQKQAKTVSPYETEITKLMSKMTLEQKVGQMAQVTLDVIGKGNNAYASKFPFELDEKMMKVVFEENKVGSILNSPTNTPLTVEEWQKVISEIQKASMKHIGIPCIYGIDAIHGATYTKGAVFLPQQIGIAATFNRELAFEGARMAAYETKASNIAWNFSPVLDMGRDARWSRIWETFGEDPYLTSEMGKSFVKGYQGENREQVAANHVAACLKHYVGYGATFTGKDREPAFISNIELYERHLRPFKEAIEQGALSIMVNSGINNGVSIHADYNLLTQVLKNDLAFDGVVVTDWADIDNLYRRDKIVNNEKEAVMLSINAGIDMSMIPYGVSFCKILVELVKENKVSMSRIDDAVRRILRLKYRLRLFEKSDWDYKVYPDFGSDKHKDIARNTAAESITLLKNIDSVLPLSKSSKILVTGPNANSMRTLNGGWTLSWQGEKTDDLEINRNTILKSIENTIGKENVVYVPGVTYKMPGKYYEENDPNVEDAVKTASQVDVIVVCVGENTYTEKPGDLDDLYLSDNQQDLVKALAKTGKPIVLVLNEGRPRIISKIEPLVKGVLQTYLPGSFGGEALAGILFGDVNPSGKLPYTYPKYPNSLLNYDYKPSQNQERMVGVYDYESIQSVQYPFGYGLSYTTYKYDKLKVDKTSFTPSDRLTISVDITNTGKVDGKESVLLFISDLVASITPDNSRLRAFDKVEIKSGETKTATFTIDAKELAFMHTDNKWHLEKGVFRVQVGGKTADIECVENQTWDSIK